MKLNTKKALIIGSSQGIGQAEQSRHFIKIVAATAALAGLLFGFDTGVISGGILFVKQQFGLSPFAEEILVSAVLVGAVFGAILSGKLTDVVGRKRTILGTACAFGAGSLPRGRPEVPPGRPPPPRPPRCARGARAGCRRKPL